MLNEKTVTLKLLALAECFEKKLSVEVLDIYINALSPFDDVAIMAAISKAGTHCKFFPKPAELIEFIHGPIPTVKDTAAVAWSKLMQAIEKKGAWKSVVFQDAPIMAAVRALGGWERVCEWRLDELNWRQKEFSELYSGLQHAEAPAYLPGIAERANIAAGHATEPPALADGNTRKVLPMPLHRTDEEILDQIALRAGI